MTVVFGLLLFLFTPRSPSEARFLSESEQLYIMERLRQDGVAANNSKEDVFNWVEVARAFMSPHVFFIAVVSFMSGMSPFCHEPVALHSVNLKRHIAVCPGIVGCLRDLCWSSF
jgi:hypothetical protein